MKIHSLKSRISAGDLVVGAWQTLNHPSITEIFTSAGYDFLVVDMEHSSMTVRDAEDLIRAATLSQVPALVRLTSNDRDLAKRVMDSGATGIIVPMVNSREDAKRAVRSVYYPPKGDRGVGLARAQGFGTKFQSYWDWSGSETVVIVQIEHVDAVRNINEILGTEGVDGYILGPYDLSASLGMPGKFDSSPFKESVACVRAAAAKYKKTGGIHIVEPDLKLLKDSVADGFRFLAYSLDIRLISQAAHAGIKVVGELAKKEQP